MKKALIVGGANGIGLSIAICIAERKDVEKVYIVDRASLDSQYANDKFESVRFNLETLDYTFFDKFKDIDTLIITAGFGRLCLFEDLDESYIISSFNVNAIAPIRLIKHFYNKLLDCNPFNCAIMVSIAGFMSSPFFSVYGATKAALKIFIESVNVELEKAGSPNRILNVSPGSIKGTAFNNGKNDLALTRALALEIINRMENHNDLYIPQYEEIFKNVLDRYHKDFRAEGVHSYEYKIASGRLES